MIVCFNFNNFWPLIKICKLIFSSDSAHPARHQLQKTHCLTLKIYCLFFITIIIVFLLLQKIKIPCKDCVARTFCMKELSLCIVRPKSISWPCFSFTGSKLTTKLEDRRHFTGQPLYKIVCYHLFRSQTIKDINLLLNWVSSIFGVIRIPLPVFKTHPKNKTLGILLSTGL